MWQLWCVCVLCLFAGAFIGVLAMAVLSAGKCDRCIEDCIMEKRMELAKKRGEL